MSIKVNIPDILHDFTNGKSVIEVNGNTVGECLKHLVGQFPTLEKRLFDPNGNLLNYLAVFINGRIAYGEVLLKPVKDGDKIYIFPIIEGG